MTERIQGAEYPDTSVPEEVEYISSEYTREYRLGAYEPGRTILDVLEGASYRLGESSMLVSDPVWGDAYIGDKQHDRMLLELARTPLFRRSQAIEQLTLGPEYATMPNSMYFSRWQHIWGSLAFVRKMTELDDRYDERERMVLQMRTLVSDLGHTIMSHLGDWMFQGKQGGEDMHDAELRQILESSGVGDIIRRHGMDVEEVAFPDKTDFIEAPSPALCVDRVDYGFRELLRWGNTFLPFGMLKQALQDPRRLFEIDEEQRLIMTDERIAGVFAAGYALLPTEHWAHPVHRLQLELLEASMKSIIVEDVAGLTEHPRDAMYGIDADASSYYRTWNVLHFDKIMRDIALSQRTIFAEARQFDLRKLYASFFEDVRPEFPEFPDPLQAYSWQSERYGLPYPSQLRIDQVHEAAPGVRATDYGLQVGLEPLKARSIDPLVRTGSDVVPLSELNESYARYLEGQRAMMARSYEATVLIRADVAERIADTYQDIERNWQEALDRPRNVEAMRHRIEQSMPYAAAYSFDRIYEVEDEDISSRVSALGKLGLL